MTVDLRSIPTQVIIQQPTPLDVSQAFVSLSISGNALDDSGWYRPRGQIVLGQLPGFAESFDCRVNLGRWAPGNIVSVSVWLGGVWVPLPWRLRILAYPNRPMPGSRTITLEVGTDADLLNYRAPEGDPGTDEYGTPTGAQALINRALAQAGAPALVTGTAISTLNLSFSPEKNTGGSWMSYAGSVAYASRHVLWQRTDGAIVATPLTLDGLTPVTAYTVGTNEADYILEAPGEQPPEVVQVQGTTYKIESAEPQDTDVTENINGVITRTRVEYKDWNTSEPKIIETIFIPLELMNIGFFVGNARLSEYKRITNIKTYDNWNRLVQEVTQTEMPKFTVPFTEENSNRGTISSALMVVGEAIVTYEFPVVQSNDTELLRRLKTAQVISRRITKEKALYLPQGSSSLVLQDRIVTTETWEEKGPELYLYRVNTRDDSNDPLKPPPINQEPQFVPPPATNFKPAEKQRTELASQGKATFTNAVGSSYAEKKWVLSLPSGMGVSADQCRAHAALWGKVRQGRQFQIKWSGDLTADWLTNFSPVRRVDFTLNGITTAYLVEAFNLAIDQRSAAMGGLGLELGQVDGANLVPPYVQINDFVIEQTMGRMGAAVSVALVNALSISQVMQRMGAAVDVTLIDAATVDQSMGRMGGSLRVDQLPTVTLSQTMQRMGGNVGIVPVIAVDVAQSMGRMGAAVAIAEVLPYITYLRPDGTSEYRRPDGTSTYERP